MTISHQKSKRDGLVLRRTLVRLDRAEIPNPESGGSTTATHKSVYVTLELPEDVAHTVPQLQDMVTQLKNFLSSANVIKLLNGEP